MKKNISKEAYYERLRNLAEVNKDSLKETRTRNLGTLIDYKRSADGIAYGIVKENHNYYIKKGGLKENLDVSDFVYIGGLENITEYQYKTFSDADKNRSMLLATINNSYNLKLDESKVKLSKEDAGEEIKKASEKLNDLDALTAKASSSNKVTDADLNAEKEMEAGLKAQPSDEKEESEKIPEKPEMEKDKTEDDMEQFKDNENSESEDGESEETNDASLSPEDKESLVKKEIEKTLGKLTHKIRKTHLEPSEIKSYVNTYLAAFKDKIDKVDIEDRKVMADKILKVVPDEEISSVSEKIPQNDEETEEIEEEVCNECGGFGRYAESWGYTKESLMECDNEVLANLISGYANAYNDGQNNGDFKLVALFVNPELLNKLKDEYGHNDYVQKLTPYVDQLSESDEEDKMAQIDELWSGLKGAVGKIGSDIKAGAQKAGQAVAGTAQKAGQAVTGAAQKAGQAVTGAAQKAGQAVTGAAQKAGQAVAGVAQKAGQIKAGAQKAGQAVASTAQKAGQAVGQYAQGVKQAYYSAEVNNEIKKLEDVAANLGKQINILNTKLEKAGKSPINAKSILATIQNQISSKGSANLGKYGVSEEVSDPVAIEVQPNLKEEDESNEKEQSVFTPDSDILGGDVIKPTESNIEFEDVDDKGENEIEIKDSTVNITMNESEKKPSAGLSKEKKSEVVKAAKSGKDIGKKGKHFEDVVEKAKKYGAKDPEAVAAAAMWKNIKRESVEEEKNIDEKWNKDVKVKKTGEHAGKTIEEIDKELAALKRKSEKYQEEGKPVPKEIIEKERELIFAKRAKRHWKEGVESKEVMSESEMKLRKYIRARLEEKLGLRKSILDENKKSPLLKKLDEMIDKQYDEYKYELGVGEKKERVQTNESEMKLRKYIRARLEEKMGLKKSTLDENKKSPLLKKLDEMIDKQYELYKSIK